MCDSFFFRALIFEIDLKAFYWNFFGPFSELRRGDPKNSSPKKVYQTIGTHESPIDPLSLGLPKYARDLILKTMMHE